MAFVNEKISDKDKARISPILAFEKVKQQARWIPKFSEPSRWTIDREREVYLLFLTGGGREQSPYYALGINNQLVVFNADNKSKGDDISGIQGHWIVYNLKIPTMLESHRKEIKESIIEGLEEYAHFRPFADGGTPSKPNTIARGKIISFKVEFK